MNDKIIINNPHNFLNFANINQIMMDKSKTITTGEMEIFSVYFRRKKYELDKEGTNLYARSKSLFEVKTDGPSRVDRGSWAALMNIGPKNIVDSSHSKRHSDNSMSAGKLANLD